MANERTMENDVNTPNTHPSSFCTLAKGFAILGDAGPAPVVAAAALPPPPRRGFAIRPKLNGEPDAAFWAG